MMLSQTRWLTCGLAVCVAAAQCVPARGQKPEDRSWRLSEADGRAILAFGSDNAEDTPVVFDCKAGSGTVRVFVAETDAALKANQKLVATFVAGAATSKVPGRTVANEDAGIPSFRGTLPATDPLFAAFSAADDLSIQVGAAHQDVPLQLIGEHATEFAGLCRRAKRR
jgi:hypothetical protein